MAIEPLIDRGQLVETVWRDYGLHITGLTFLPMGEGSYPYVAECANGGRYLLKLSRALHPAAADVERLDFMLRLSWTLFSKRLFICLPCPVTTRDGRLWARFHQRTLALFTFIPGHPLPDGSPLDGAILEQLAHAVAMVHRSTPALGIDLPYVEAFDIPFEHALIAALAALEHVTARDRWGKRAVRDLLLPRHADLLGHLRHLRRLQRRVRARPREMVLCHSDLHAGNLLLDDAGTLYILDWQTAKLAPAEHDLWFFLGNSFDPFLAIYERERGPVSLDADLFGFYLYRRNLEDLDYWVQHILCTNTDEEQDESDVAGVALCIEDWPALEEQTAAVYRFRRMRPPGHGAQVWPSPWEESS